MKLLSFFLIALILQCHLSTAQAFSLSISYTTAEKSKDSHSTNETFTINGTAVAYSVTYTGRRGPNQTDETKACTFTSEQITKIQQTMVEKKLNVTDSLIITSTGMSSVAISIAMKKDNIATRIKVNGGPVELSGKLLYQNSLSFISTIKKMLEGCP